MTKDNKRDKRSLSLLCSTQRAFHAVLKNMNYGEATSIAEVGAEVSAEVGAEE